MKELTDKDFFPFGQYRDVPMEKVPAAYLDWLMGMDWIDRWPQVVTYVNKNRALIDKELEEQGRI